MSVVDQARKLKKDLEAGQVTLAEIVAWADGEIARADQPLDEIIDLSMVKSEYDALTLLGNLITNHSD